MNSQSYQASQYGYATAGGPYPGSDPPPPPREPQPEPVPAQYRGNGYQAQSQAPAGQYDSGFGYDFPAGDYRQYEGGSQGGYAAAGQSGQSGQYGNQENQGDQGYDLPAGDYRMYNDQVIAPNQQYGGTEYGYRTEQPTGYGYRTEQPTGYSYRTEQPTGYSYRTEQLAEYSRQMEQPTGYQFPPPPGMPTQPTAYPDGYASTQTNGQTFGYATETQAEQIRAPRATRGTATDPGTSYQYGAGQQTAARMPTFTAPAQPAPPAPMPEPPAEWFRPESQAQAVGADFEAAQAEAVGLRTFNGQATQAEEMVPEVEVTGQRRLKLRSSRLSEGLRRQLILGTLVGLAASTMWIWWLGSWTGGIDSTENLVGSVGQVAGLMAEYLLMVQVLLMARVPWLERAIGTEHLTKAHVILGFSLVGMIIQHVVCATYLNLAPGLPLAAGLGGVFLALRDVLAATVGTMLLFGVVFLSTKRMRQRIPYEVWRYLHLFVYVGIGLEFIHQMTLGIHFLNSQVAEVYWIALHAITLYCVLWYRFGTIIRRNLRHRLQVDRVVQEGPGVYSLYFTGERLEKFHGTAGQFCRWRFLNREGWWQSHPFSLSAAPTSQYLRITVKQLGDWTKLHLPDLEPGTPVFFSGPYGGLTPSRRKRRKVLLVAAGIGITPMRSLLAGLPAGPGDITLLYRASSEKDLVFRAELDELARQRGATVHYLIGPRKNFKGGDPLGAAQLKELVPSLHRHDVYLCGPDGMIEAAVRGLHSARVPRRQIHTERFAF